MLLSPSLSLSLSHLISYCFTLDSILMMSPTQNSVMLEFFFQFYSLFFFPGVIHWDLANCDVKYNQERFGLREGESVYFVKLQTCGEIVGSTFQTELKSFEAQVPFAVGKTQFPCSKENKHIKRGPRASWTSKLG